MVDTDTGEPTFRGKVVAIDRKEIATVRIASGHEFARLTSTLMRDTTKRATRAVRKESRRWISNEVIRHHWRVLFRRPGRHACTLFVLPDERSAVGLADHRRSEGCFCIVLSPVVRA
jgi:hypothetical protein